MTRALDSNFPRQADRKRMLLTATLISPAGQSAVRIKDLSGTGAHIVLDSPVEADCDAILKRGSLFAAGRITWVAGRECGIEFFRKMSADELLQAASARDS